MGFVVMKILFVTAFFALPASVSLGVLAFIVSRLWMRPASKAFAPRANVADGLPKAA